MSSEDISVIRHWTNEISNYGSRTSDPAAPVMVRALEALEATTTPYYDHDQMDRTLTTLRNELPDALRANGEDAFRLSVVGLVESVHRTLHAVAERRRRDEPHLQRPADAYSERGAVATYEDLRAAAFVIKQEPIDDWALPENVLEEEALLVNEQEEQLIVKEEPLADDYNWDVAPPPTAPLRQETMPQLERMEPGEEVKVEQLDADVEDSPARPSKRTKTLLRESAAGADAGSKKMKKERRSRKDAVEAVKRRGFNYMDTSDEEGDGTQASRAAKRPKRLSIKKEELSGALGCVLCDYQTSAVGAFICHLKKRHGTTPAKMGIWFRCECGHLSRSNGHAYRKKEPGCGGASSTLIFVTGSEAARQGPANGEEEWRPPRAAGGREAVQEMQPDDGEEVDVTLATASQATLKNTVKKRKAPAPAPAPRPKRASAARPINYSELNGGGDEEEEVDVVEVAPETTEPSKASQPDDFHAMDCVLCEASLPTVHTYIHHLKQEHATTAKREGIWFRCACGYVCQSGYHASSKKCDVLAASLATIVYGVERGAMDEDNDEDKEGDDVTVDEEEEHQKVTDVDDKESQKADDGRGEEEEEEVIEEAGGYLEIVRLNDSSRVLNEFGLEEEKEEDEEMDVDKDPSAAARCCHICKKHSPRTIGQFVEHLRKKHATTLLQSGVWLECACGTRINSYAQIHTHSKQRECDGSSFTVQRRDDQREN